MAVTISAAEQESRSRRMDGRVKPGHQRRGVQRQPAQIPEKGRHYLAARDREGGARCGGERPFDAKRSETLCRLTRRLWRARLWQCGQWCLPRILKSASDSMSSLG